MSFYVFNSSNSSANLNHPNYQDYPIYILLKRETEDGIISICKERKAF